MEMLTAPGPEGTRLEAADHGIGFFDDNANVGAQGFGLRLETDGVEAIVQYDGGSADAEGIQIDGLAGKSGLRCRTEVRPIPGLKAVSLGHTLTNASCRDIAVGAVTSGQFCPAAAIRLGRGQHRDRRFCHTDNVRTERYPYCQGEFPYVRPLPTRPVRLGIGEDQPFPALYLTDQRYSCGLVIASLGQETTYQSWEICKAPATESRVAFRRFYIHHEFPQCPQIVLAPGENLALDAVFIQILEDTHPQTAYADYLDLLSSRYEFRGPTTSIRREAFYCTWNYGRFQEQIADELLTTAKFISENLPRLKIFLVDAGYQLPAAHRQGLANSFLDGFYPDPAANVDAAKFPQGMKAFSREIRQLGLRPGIWWSPMARLDSSLYADHPDWFLRTADGDVYRIGEAGYLDLTLAPARDFIDRTLAVVLGDWEMDALKMDFWSQSVESRQVIAGRDNASAVESRRTLFEIVRQHLPPDGVFMTCVAVGMGNPFIAAHADSYRNTIDIGAGHWQDQRDNCLWALPTLGLEGRKSFLLNNDSVGVNLDCPENENFFRLTWCFITMGLQEVGGKLEALPELYQRAMRRYTDRCDRGYPCLCADERAFTGEPFPRVLYVDYPDDSPTRQDGVRQSLALFNWTDEPDIVAVARGSLGHDAPVEAVNFWTDERETFADEFIIKRLPPRSALLYDILA